MNYISKILLTVASAMNAAQVFVDTAAVQVFRNEHPTMESVLHDALARAVRTGNLEAFTALVDKNNYADQKTQLVELLGDSMADPVQVITDFLYATDMKSVLLQAFETEYYGTKLGGIPLLFHNGFDANQELCAGRTGLFFAVKLGDRDAVTLFLDNGADVNHEDADGSTPLFGVLPSQTKDPEGSLWFTEPWTRPSYAFTDLEIANVLIDNKSDVNHVNRFGHTVLLVAASQLQLAIVTLLIDNNANVEQPDNLGRTPLFMAARHKNLAMVQLLTERGANVNHEDNFGRKFNAYLWA